ncbi:MAG: phospholipase D-like domain-containing protein [Kiritimatiellia bacterium]
MRVLFKLFYQASFIKTTRLCLLLIPFLHLASGPFFLPEGMCISATARVDKVRLLIDECWVDNTGTRCVSQEIFREVHKLIQRADEFIVMDIFLLNNFGYTPGKGYYPLSDKFTGWIIDKKRNNPDIQIILISDPINTLYDSLESPHYKTLEQAGVQLVITDLDKLPDSNPIYSIPWRLSVGLLGSGPGWMIPNPMGDDRISLRSFLKLLNMKANHRKTILSENEMMVMSANPHSGSSAHWNTALHVKGGGMKMLWESEKAVMRFSGVREPPELHFEEKNGSAFQVELCTEEKIRDRAVNLLDDLKPGGRVDLSMFYLSDGDIISALIHAAERGCYMRIILDANKDAFGREKNGIPNRQTAALLNEHNIPVRWAHTSGEQFHVKMLYVETLTGKATLMTGSANYTRRNIGNFNAESCLAVTGSVDADPMTKQRQTFDRWWNNTPQRSYTLDYSIYADENRIRRFTAWLQEISGLSSF